MSQPPYDYTQYLGQPPHHPYLYAPAPHIQPASSFYATPQESSPSTVAGNYTALNGSFEYNGSRIPGLGMSTTSVTPLQPSYHTIEPSSSRPPNPYAGRLTSTAPAIPQNQGIIGLDRVHQDITRSIPVQPTTAQSAEASEEGELSEGEFEDLYEPRCVGGASENIPEDPAQNTAVNDDPTGSAGDADGSSIYDTGSTREEMVIDSNSASQPAVDEDDDDYEPGEYEPEYQSRDRSRSYSPCLSPKESGATGLTAELNNPGGQVSAPMRQSPSSFAPHENPLKQAADRTVSSTKNQVAQPPPTFNSNQASSALAAPYKSVQEAKKKAQEAILGLWPLKVRYQNYLDEGLDPQVVKSLFRELGLDASTPKPAVSLDKTPVSTSTNKPESPSRAQPSPKPIVPPAPAPAQPSNPVAHKPATGGDSKTESKKSAQEERKDKIARMLAEKSKKNAVQPQSKATPVPTPPVSSTATASAETSDPAKVKLRAQNNQKILEKLAALKKQQGKKLESTEQGTSTAASEITKSQVSNVDETVVTSQRVAPNGTSTGELDNSSSTTGGPLGLSISSSPQPIPKSRITKRPIASDFDGYTPNGSVPKRTRTQETLIIDVSDDEDVEMDLGSPTEPPSRAIQNNALPRQNSLASFPPLSHTRDWRGQRSSPATPAAGTPSEHGHKLDFLTQQILAAKKRIAEAEAKKAVAKKSNGVPTPSIQSPAPTPGPQESVRLPKPSELSEALKSERRNRIASYDIPVLDAALEEKQNRLQRLQAEAAQLALEVEATLNERQKLAVEMDSLDVVKPTSPELNGAREESPAAITATPDRPADIPAHVADDDAEQTPSNIPVGSAEHAAATEEVTEPSIDITNMDVNSDAFGNSSVSHNTTAETSGSDASVEGQNVTSAVPNEQLLGTATMEDALILPQGASTDEGDSSTSQPTAETSIRDFDDQVPDADVPMQISDAEDDDSYEPIPQISDVDTAQAANGEDGEVKIVAHYEKPLLIHKQIPDEEPYEPNPAQVEPTEEAVSEAATGEVQVRSSQEPLLLTTAQATPQGTLSAKELLSYESPLRYFHAYKFHPKFKDNVSGGLKSMTYSSKIDPSRPICPSLLADGQCLNGSSCEFQHFDSMALSESAIIAELGSTDMYTGEQKDRFIDGLKKVLQDLKTKKLKDFDSITKALVQYRNDFLGDKSKVLPLNDVVI